MGFVVNKKRFLNTGPAPVPMLIPYSNSSKIITYLVPENFNGSDSTTWGDEYTCPMDKSGASWSLTSDGKSVCIQPTSTYQAIIRAPSNLYNFTVYLVAQYSGADISLRVRSSSFPSYIANLLCDSTGISTEVGSYFTSWDTGNYSMFTGTAYGAFQTYALSYPRNDKAAHILNDSSLKRFPKNGTKYPSSFAFEQYDLDSSEVYIKLLAIVSEAESDTVLQNNVNYIRTQLNLT